MNLKLALVWTGAVLLYMGWKRITFHDIVTGHATDPASNPTDAYGSRFTAATGSPLNTVGSALGSGQSGLIGSSGTAYVDGKPVASWIANILRAARASGRWHGKVTSGVRTDAQQTRIYKSGVRPAAVPKSMGGPGSNHEGVKFPFGAVDVTDPKGLASYLSHSAYRGILQYAGSKDPVHFSHPHGGGY